MADEHAKLSLRRTGGLIGVPMEASLDTQSLPDAEAKAITDALDSIDLDTLQAAEDWPSGAADTFHYELTVKRGEGNRTASFSDRQVPPSLAPLIRTLMSGARPVTGEGGTGQPE